MVVDRGFLVMQQFLNVLRLPQGQGLFLDGVGAGKCYLGRCAAEARSKATMSSVPSR
jgi:hypothetical protein